MFPTFSSITQKQPRLFALFGIALFCFGLYLIYMPREESLTVPESMNEEREDTFDTRTLLVPPEGEKTADYEAQVAMHATVSDTITISDGCAMDPLIIELKANSTLKIENKDTTEHTIAFEDQNFFNVSPGQTRELNVSETFNKGAGIYRYRCNDLSLEKSVGVMYLTE